MERGGGETQRSVGRERTAARNLAASALALTLALAVAACTKERLGVAALSAGGESTVNDPSNRTLRFELIELGLGELCREMTSRLAPLRRQPSEPAVGRFAARTCEVGSRDAEQKRLGVRFEGEGVAFLRPTGRIGFSSAASVTYAPDFRLRDGELYVYFRAVGVESVGMRVLMVEEPLARFGVAIAPGAADALGREVLAAELGRGFTVVRRRDGSAAFYPGLVAETAAPADLGVAESSEGGAELDRGRSELFAGQQDYLGIFPVKAKGEALFLDVLVEGAPAADVAILDASAGRQMFAALASAPGLPPVLGPIWFAERVPRAVPWKRAVPVPPGHYVVVLTSAAAANGPAAGAARVDVRVGVGEAP